MRGRKCCPLDFSESEQRSKFMWPKGFVPLTVKKPEGSLVIC